MDVLQHCTNVAMYLLSFWFRRGSGDRGGRDSLGGPGWKGRLFRWGLLKASLLLLHRSTDGRVLLWNKGGEGEG